VAIIEAVGEAMPEPVMRAEPNMAFGRLLALAIAPVIIIPLFLWVKKVLSRRKK
jgi:hypothetical protein